MAQKPRIQPIFGACTSRPPNRESSRVWKLCCTEPAMKKSMPVIRPCATMPKIAALMPNVVSDRDAEHHEAHVRDGRERDQPFHVGLRETAERAVDDADDGE